MKILVIDDSRAMRRVVARTIRQAGYEDAQIVEAENGAEALDMVRMAAPDLVLSDWDMPGMTGLELLKALRETGDTTPLGFVVSNATKGMVAQARAAGAVFLLAKPFTAEDMAKVLGVLIVG